MNVIVLSKSQRKQLRERYNYSECTLSESLHFKRRSIISRRIRAYAVNHLNGICFID